MQIPAIDHPLIPISEHSLGEEQEDENKDKGDEESEAGEDKDEDEDEDDTDSSWKPACCLDSESEDVVPHPHHPDRVLPGMKIDIADYAGSWSLVRRLVLELNRLYLKLIDTTPSHHNSS